jgi:serine/threonine protein kinase
MWTWLSNPNILPFLGAYIRGSELVVVSEWMENGNIKEYLRINPRVNRHSLVMSSRF